MAYDKELQRLFDLQGEFHTQQAAWVKHMLSLAVGALAILSGLRPSAGTELQAYLLIGTWLFLGIGIIAGAAATYAHVSRAKRLAKAYGNELVERVRIGDMSNPAVTAGPSFILSGAFQVMVVALLIVVCCLVAFSISAVLNPADINQPPPQPLSIFSPSK